MPKKAKVTCLTDYHPVALTSVAMKCFERLVMAHINSILPVTLDPLQFAYRPNRSTDDTISIAQKPSLKPPNSKQCRCRSTVVRKNSLERPKPRKKTSTLTLYRYPLYMDFTLTLYRYPLYID